MTKVKICGVSEPETLRAAVRAGADWIGFVFVEASPRVVTPAAAASLLLHVGDAVPVALLANASDTEIEAVRATGITRLQLHGHETPDRVSEVKDKFGVEVWKALGVASRGDVDRLADFGNADRLLIDAKPPKGADRDGGNGVSFDWSLLDGWSPTVPWMLAGGLTVSNVAEAIAVTNAMSVDVSTGVERAPGVKDAALIKAFIEAAKHG